MSGQSTITDRHIGGGRVGHRARHFGPVIALFALTCIFSSVTRAESSSINTLLMPGPLAASHAKEENNCDSCHSDFDKGAQDRLCVDCHEDIAADTDQKAGFHGHLDLATTTCSSCHTDHKGRDFDIVGLSPATFDHNLTDFELEGQHRQASCRSCHEEGKKWREAPQECSACHESDDVHNGQMNEECGTCHSAKEWATTEFDHGKTGFELEGSHSEASCLACHPGNQYDRAPDTCQGCHAADDVHKGRRGSDCSQCHDSREWDKSLFNHTRDGNYELLGAHKKASCNACHNLDRFEDTPGDTCVACHAVEDVHAGRNGTECNDCHGVKEWKTTTFDHTKDTDFPLHGAHEDIACSRCHVEDLESELPLTCNGCHQSDDPHAGSLGESCERCHSESDWTKSVRFDHDLSAFPLLGAHSFMQCNACHVDQRYAETDSRCVDCHSQDDHHDGALGEQCERCHSPVDWSVWRFDHNADTDYPLEGEHENVACSDCHTDDATRGGTPTRCFDCHRGDDRHRGQFGRECDRCHRPDGWPVISMQNKYTRGSE